jgi:hypothetical protein
MLDEYLDRKQQKQQKEVMEHIYSIFCWGVVFGVILSYMSIFPLLFGTVIGYVMNQKRWLMMEQWMEQWKPWIEVGHSFVLDTMNKFDKKIE